MCLGTSLEDVFGPLCKAMLVLHHVLQTHALTFINEMNVCMEMFHTHKLYKPDEAVHTWYTRFTF